MLEENAMLPPGLMKRQRAGSISGRLRTASDLSDYGLIDQAQKGLIKDMIISGDTRLQSALDKFAETRDFSELQGNFIREIIERCKLQNNFHFFPKFLQNHSSSARVENI